MFSLIITIVAIALVAALALATLYFGGDAFNRGSQDAQASKLLVQGQQITGALTLYQVDHGSLPNTSDLSFLTQVSPVTGKVYLKTIPVAYLVPDLVQNALAADIEWRMVPGKNTIHTEQSLDVEVCRAVNKRMRNDDGILNVVSTQYVSQCFEESPGTYKLYVSTDQAFAAAGIPSQKIVSIVAPVTDNANAVWAVAPNSILNSEVPSGGSGSSGTSLSISWISEISTDTLFSATGLNSFAIVSTQVDGATTGGIRITNNGTEPVTFNAENSVSSVWSGEEISTIFGMSIESVDQQANSLIPGSTFCKNNNSLNPGETCILYIQQDGETCTNQTVILSGISFTYTCAVPDPYSNYPMDEGIIVVSSRQTVPWDPAPEDYSIDLLADFGTVSYPRATGVSRTITIYNTQTLPLTWSILPATTATALELSNTPQIGHFSTRYTVDVQDNFVITSSCGAVVPARSPCDITLTLKTDNLIQRTSDLPEYDIERMSSNFTYIIPIKIAYSDEFGGFSTNRHSKVLANPNIPSLGVTEELHFLRWRLSGY